MTKKNEIIKLIIYFIFILICFFVFINIIQIQRVDFDYHVYKMFSSDPAVDFYHENNLFYYLMYLFHIFLNIKLEYSAAIILTLGIALKVLVLDSIFKKSNKNQIVVAIFVCISSLSMSLFNPVTGKIYLGQHVGNIWHNPPFILMLPFAIVCVELFIETFVKDNKTVKKLVLMSIMMFLSFLAKPSFIVSFIPACGIYIIYKGIKRKSFKSFINDLKSGVLVSLPVIIYFVLFYIMTFVNVQDKTFTSICISPFGVWAYFLGINNMNIDLKIVRIILKTLQFLISFVCANAFSIFYLVANRKWKDDKFKYLIILFGVGVFYFTFFAQTGDTFYDGNFSWNYAIGGIIIFIYCVNDLISTRKQNGFIKYYIEVVLCSLHALSGCYYLYLLISNVISI